MPNAGDKVPSVTIKQATAEGPKDVDPAALFAGKKVVMFTLPGAYTPTCSNQHLPGYVAKLDEIKARGVDLVACLSVNDGWVMKAWAEQHGALGKIVMLADGNADFSKALGIELDLSGPCMGMRCRRGLITIEDGVIKTIAMEAPGKFEVSGAEACMVSLG
ncbi:MAG: peroxiredoxin [Kofleriaceae bacterium]|nr:MAG: peroxiredoxin [Kofleriaceae bacterium]MBZ0236065.1 peroxiredoxin [Kofleriaceae bacterium]